MARQFLANLSFIIVLNLLIKPLYIFGIEVSVQNTVGTSMYGIYFALLNGAYLFQIINDFGIQIYTSRMVAQDNTAARSLFPSLLVLKGVLAILFVGAIAVYAYAMGYTDWFGLLMPIAFNLILLSFLLYLRANVAAFGLYRLDSILSVLDKLLMILVCGYLLFLSDIPFTIYHFVYAQMATLALTLVVALLVLAARQALSIRLPAFRQIRQLLFRAGPYAVAVFLMSLYTRIDGVMVEQLATDGRYAAGVYAAGYRLLEAANMIAYLFAVLLLPMFSGILGDRTRLIDLLALAFRFMWTLTISVSVMTFFFREDLIHLFYTEATGTWAPILGILILSFNAVGLMYVFGTYLTALGVIRRLNKLYVICVVVNILLNWILIPRYSALGAAVATLFTQAVVAISLMWMVRLQLRPLVDLRDVMRPAVFVLITAITAYALSQYATGLHWTWRFAASMLIILGGVFATGMVHQRELRRFLSMRETPV